MKKLILLLFVTMQLVSCSSIKEVSCPLTDPTPSQITEWASKYKGFCEKQIKQLGVGYNIPDEMLATDPCLAYLVLTAESIDKKEERQGWFDLYSLMDRDQITKLYGILYRERHKLEELRGKKE